MLGIKKYDQINDGKRLISDLGTVDPRVVKRLSEYGVTTLSGVKLFGLSNLSRIGIYGDNLMLLLHGLEQGGIDSSMMFTQKDELDDKRMEMMNMPLVRFFDNSAILRVLYNQGYTRVKHIISIPKHVMGGIFYKCGMDGNLATDSIVETLKNAGVRMDDDYSIRFHRKKLQNLVPARKSETPILELEISQRAKRQLMTEGIFSVQGVLDMQSELGSIPGIGVGTRTEIESAIAGILSNDESEK